MSSPAQPDAAIDKAAEIRRLLDAVIARRARGEEVSDESLHREHPSLLPELAAELRKLRLIARAREQADGHDQVRRERGGQDQQVIGVVGQQPQDEQEPRRDDERPPDAGHELLRHLPATSTPARLFRADSS